MCGGYLKLYSLMTSFPHLLVFSSDVIVIFRICPHRSSSWADRVVCIFVLSDLCHHLAFINLLHLDLGSISMP